MIGPDGQRRLLLKVLMGRDNESDSNRWDAIVIGGGAAGLMACASAMQRGRRVLLLEKNVKLGVKILMSGGTRCNITHACESRGIVEAFGQPGKFLHSALAALSPAEVVQWIESEGVATKVEPGGKIFPDSDRAIDVRDALVRLASSSRFGGRISIRTGLAVRQISKNADLFTVNSDNETFLSDSVILATGGMSYPGCGTTGDGYPWARQWGHGIVNPVPALTPITNQNCWSHHLKGIALSDVALKICESVENGSKHEDSPQAKPRVIDQRRGGFLFTHFGYSGPSALNISRTVSLHSSPNQLVLECDFSPELNQEEFRQQLVGRLAQNSRQSLANVLCELFPRRFVEQSLGQLGYQPGIKAAEVSKILVGQLTVHFKQSRFPIDGTCGFKKAEVTAGGIDLKGVDSRTMQSRYCPGLFIVGEALDLDGPIGGYNFQSAFSTGWLAGQHV